MLSMGRCWPLSRELRDRKAATQPVACSRVVTQGSRTGSASRRCDGFRSPQRHHRGSSLLGVSGGRVPAAALSQARRHRKWPSLAVIRGAPRIDGRRVTADEPRVYRPGLRLRTTEARRRNGAGLRQSAAGVGGSTPSQDAGCPVVRCAAGTSHGGRAAGEGLRGDRDHGCPVRGVRGVVVPSAHAGRAEGRAGEAAASDAAVRAAAKVGEPLEANGADPDRVCGIPSECAEELPWQEKDSLTQGQSGSTSRLAEELSTPR